MEPDAADNVREVLDVQSRHGNWNFSPYMRGLYNGMELALSITENREPVLKEAPDQYLCDLVVPSEESPALEGDVAND